MAAPKLSATRTVLAGEAKAAAALNAMARTAGNGLLQTLWIESTAAAPTTPTGWTLLGSVARGTKFKEWVWGKLAENNKVGAEAEKDNFSTTWTGSVFRFGEMRLITGNVAEVAKWLVGTTSNGSGTVATVNGVTTTSAETLLIGIWDTLAEGSVKSATAGWTKDEGTWTPVHSKEQAKAEATGALEVTFNATAEWVGLMVAIPQPKGPLALEAAESVSSSDSLAKGVGKTLSDSVTVSESWSLELKKGAAAGPQAITDVVPKAILSVSVLTATGETYRWGPDEWNAINVPQAITFSTSMPGGFKTASITLPRRIDLDYPDLNLLDTIQILSPGNRVLWEGRIVQLPRSHGDAFSITVGAVGWASHLIDNPTFRRIYVDRQLGNWSLAPSAARQQALRSISYAPQDAEVVPDATTGLQSLGLKVNGHWESIIPIVEPFYDAGPGLKIAAMYNDWLLSTTDPSFFFRAFTADNDGLSGLSLGGDLAIGGSAGSGVYTPPIPQRIIGWQWFYAAAPAGVDGAQYAAAVRQLAVFGDEIAIRGSGSELGVYASDVVVDVLMKAAPLLNFTTGEGGSIQPTSYVIPQLAFREPVTAEAVIKMANGYHLWDWAVWEDRTFYYQEPSTERLTWEARLSEGAQLDLEGSQIENVFNGVLVQFNDPAGRGRSVGPLGSGADVETAELEDTSPTNPVNAHGIPRKWAILALSQTTTDAGAEQLGRIYIGEKSLPQRRGQLRLVGTVTHPTGGERLALEIRAGEWIRIADHANSGPRKVIETDADAGATAITCSLDNTSQKLDAIIERFGAVLAGVI